MKDAPFPRLSVDISAAAKKDILAAERRIKINGLVAILTDILSQDLRNPRDKSQMKDGLELGFFLYDFDCHYSVTKGVATVLKLITGTVMHKKERRVPPKRVSVA